MRVICIDGNSCVQDTVTPLVKGNVYTVIDSSDIKDYKPAKGYNAVNGLYYQLIENGYWYHSSLFIQINEDQQDESEIMNKRENINQNNKCSPHQN